MDWIYRMPIAWVNRCVRNVTVEPDPFGNPHTVKVTIPLEVTPDLVEALGEKYATAILPREMFSAEVNKKTGA